MFLCKNTKKLIWLSTNVPISFSVSQKTHNYKHNECFLLLIFLKNAIFVFLEEALIISSLKVIFPQWKQPTFNVEANAVLK